MRNLGLSGMNSLKMSADEMLGTEHSTTNTRQLLKSSGPRKNFTQVLGITSQAKPADKGKHRWSIFHKKKQKLQFILREVEFNTLCKSVQNFKHQNQKPGNTHHWVCAIFFWNPQEATSGT